MELPFDVRIFVERTFASDESSEALSLLSQARIEDGSVPNARLIRCAAFASHGDLTSLRRVVRLLALDWRDVVMAGEYEMRDQVTVHVRDLSQPLQV